MQDTHTTINRQASNESLSETFSTEIVYDGVGRVFQEFERFMHVYRPNSGLQYNYNTNGYLASLQESRGGPDGLVYQLVESMDPWGNVIMSQLGNDVIVSADYDPLTGRLVDTLATSFNNAIVQNLHYEWDLIGNLKEKKDVTSNKASIVTHEQTETYTYDGVTYCYDINGNNTSSSDGRSITYTAYNKPSRIELGADASEFFYGPNRSRYRRLETVRLQSIWHH